MKKKNEVIEIIKILKDTYPDAKCSLDFTTPFEMLVSVMLSAQCTDERVNKTTPSIFCKYSTPQDFVDINLSKLEKLIYPCGFYKTKAKHLKECAKKIVFEYNGEVPKSMDELVKLPGIGRKCANVIMLNAFNSPCGIAVDTHAKRLSYRLGLTNNTQPDKIEQDLLMQIPNKYLKDVNHLFVYHGRNLCTAKSPQCDKCPIRNYCDMYIKK